MIFLDSFSGAASDLKPSQRTRESMLAVLAKSPRVSTWDMSEHCWLRTIIADLKERKMIDELAEPYPWHRYALTDAGCALLAD